VLLLISLVSELRDASSPDLSLSPYKIIGIFRHLPAPRACGFILPLFSCLRASWSKIDQPS
jgi:hypothetical protein